MADMVKLRVLLIAPEHSDFAPLAWVKELAGLTALGVELVFVGADQATLNQIGARLHEPYDMLIWAGHGADDQLLTTDGLVDGNWLAAQLRTVHPRVVLIMACMSADLDDNLDSITRAISDAGIDCIGVRAQIEDHVARVFAREFVRATMANSNASQATRIALSMARPYGAVKGIDLVPGASNGYLLSDRLATLERTVARMDGQIASNSMKLDLVLMILQKQV